MQHGNGHGNGKRWLLIGLLVLGGFWLINDAYSDGYRDALVQSGQAGTVRYYRGGPDFPWGLLILGGIGYIAWRKGAFDRFGGPPPGGERGIQRYGGGPAYGGFRGPRGYFEEWHRESHEAERTRSAAPPVPPAAATAPAAEAANGFERGPMAETPAPSPPPSAPAPEYWAAMGQTATAAPAPTAAQPATGTAAAENAAGASGPAVERW